MFAFKCLFAWELGWEEGMTGILLNTQVRDENVNVVYVGSY